MNAKVSTFAGVSNTPKGSATLSEVFQDIISDKLKATVQQMRLLLANGEQRKFDNLKKRLPSFTPAGEFSPTRVGPYLKVYSQYVVYDLDHIPADKLEETKNLLATDPHTVLAFISPSGLGIKVLVRVIAGKEDHATAFHDVCHYFDQLTGLEGDPTGKDLARLCFYSYDPKACYNPQAKPFELQQTPVVAKVLVPEHQSTFRKAIASVSRDVKFEQGNRNNFVHYLACECNRLGIPFEATLELILASEFSFEGKEVTATVTSAYTNTDEFGLKHQAASKLLAIMEYLKSKYELRRNIVLNRIEYKRLSDGKSGLYDEIVEHSMLIEMKLKQISVNKTDLQTLVYSDRVPEFNPFKEYLHSLPMWDGVTDHIQDLCRCLTTAESDYTLEMLRRFLVAIAACHLLEKANHIVLVLQGPQGIGKTRFNSHLVPKSLKRYFYSGDLDPHNKDSEINLSECWLIDLDDIGSKTKRGLDELKSLITKEHIRLRMPYAANNERFPRRASISASSNNERFLTDLSGNRRFVCIELEAIDLSKLSMVNMDQVYAQAVAMYYGGFRYWFNAQDVDRVNARNEKHRTKSIVEEYILEDFEPGDEAQFQPITAVGISRVLIAKHKLRAQDDLPEKIGKIMTKLKFEYVKKNGRKCYKVKCKFSTLDPEIIDLFGN